MAHAQVLLAQLVHVGSIFHILQLGSSLGAALGGSQLKIGLGADAVAHCQILLAQLIHILCVFHILQLCGSLGRAFVGSQLQISLAADAVPHAQVLLCQHQAAIDILLGLGLGSSNILVGHAGLFLKPGQDSVHILSLVQHASEFIINNICGIQSFYPQVQIKIVQTEEGQNAVNNNLCIVRMFGQLSNFQVLFNISFHLKNLSSQYFQEQPLWLPAC